MNYFCESHNAQKLSNVRKQYSRYATYSSLVISIQCSIWFWWISHISSSY